MRQEEFKMERTGLVEIGQVIPITEGKLPNSYYYTLGKAYAMSANYAVSKRIKSKEGKVVEIKDVARFANNLHDTWIEGVVMSIPAGAEMVKISIMADHPVLTDEIFLL